MAVFLKRSLAKSILKFSGIKGDTVVPAEKYQSFEEILTTCIKFNRVSKKTSINSPQLFLSLSDLEKQLPGLSSKFLTACKDIQACSQPYLQVVPERVEPVKDHIYFTFKPCELSKIILKKVLKQKDTYGYHGIVPDKNKQTILVEFSSPNIAKPFHAGHLRSTIIGNFISNLYEAVGHKVIKINYLGDWGTQFGLLAQGYNLYGNEEDMKKDPMKHLYQVYVKINKDVAKEKELAGPEKFDSGKTHKRSMEIFQQMENGKGEELHLWKRLRELSIEKYREVYERLNIKFTDYEGESMFSKKSVELINQLRERGLLHIDENTGQGYVDISDTNEDISRAIIQKSDGTTLYLTRDIAAALDRHERYTFNKIHYVVEDGQQVHFKSFISVLKKLKVSWLESCKDQFHVKFGRISNISTRKGTAVFLEDILDEAKEQMINTMKSKQTTKQVDCTEKVADILGISSILIQDLKRRRQNTYKFSWERMMSFKGDTGVTLQYAHARLCSLIELCGCNTMNEDFDTKYLTEPEAIQLVLHIARYEEMVVIVLKSLEACHIVHYLFELGTLVSAAHRNLKVKDQPTDLAQARLQAFKCAKMTLANGMKLLGITPLEKM